MLHVAHARAAAPLERFELAAGRCRGTQRGPSSAPRAPATGRMLESSLAVARSQTFLVGHGWAAGRGAPSLALGRSASDAPSLALGRSASIAPSLALARSVPGSRAPSLPLGRCRSRGERATARCHFVRRRWRASVAVRAAHGNRAPARAGWRPWLGLPRAQSHPGELRKFNSVYITRDIYSIR